MSDSRDPMDQGLHQAPLCIGFSRQKYWSGLPFPSPGDLPDQELNPGLLHCRQILYHLSYEGSYFRQPFFLAPFSSELEKKKQ